MATPPEEYLCPITLTLMNDPVIGSDGRSYERSAILQWLRTNPHSPITRQPMNASSLKPNYALKSAIERYIQSQRTPRPHMLPVAVPIATAPPAEDVYYAMQIYQQDVNARLLAQQQQAARYGPTTVVVQAPTATLNPAQDQRRRKILAGCLGFTVVIILIIIISRIIIAD
jgi:hypothetical protein